MTKRIPKWKQKGFHSEAEYRAACSANKKTERAAMAASSADNGASRVLAVMWREADYHQPFVTITKSQIMEKAPCSLSTVKRAWKFLRAEGSIKPVANWEGGAKVATRFKLCVVGLEQTPSDDQLMFMEEERKQKAAWDYLRAKFGPKEALRLMDAPPPDRAIKGVQSEPQRGCKLNQKGGANSAPPPLVPQEPPCQPDGQTENKEPPSRRQEAPSGPQTPEEWRLFGEMAEGMDFEEALRLWDQSRGKIEAE